MKSPLNRRIYSLFLMLMAFLAAGSALQAYPVKITINATFTEIPGQSDPLGLGIANPPITAIITTTLDSSLPAASYPATVFLTIPGLLTNSQQTGSLSIGANGQISANFSATEGSFSAVLALPLTFPNPVPLAFGNSTFSSPASSVTYDLLGQSGKVGVNGTISALGLTASPSSISAAYTVGGTAPAPAAISVTSNDPTNPSQAYTVAVANSPTAFLTLSATSGTTPGSLTASFSTSVAPGTYTASVQITSGAGAPLSIPVTYTVTAAGGGGGGTPGLKITPTGLTFQFFTPGSTGQTQTLSVTDSVAASYTAAVATGGNFLSLGSTGGSTPGSVSVTANPGSLATGTYSGSILFTSPGAPSVTVPVTLIVGTSGGGGGTTTLSVLPTLLRFNYVAGQPAPPAQSLTIGNPTSVTFTVSNVEFYLAVTPETGHTTSAITVGLNPSGLAPGSYTDNLLVTSSAGGSINVPVIVNVAATAPVTLTAAPASLSFSYGGTAPASQTIALTGSSALSFTAATSTPWLTVTPASGSTPGTLTVTANATGLAVGTYTGSIEVTASGATNSPFVIPVSFAVTQIVSTVAANPSAIAFAYQIGGSVPAAQTVTATASVSSTFTTIAASWLTVTQASGVATLTVNPVNLAPGIYVGALAITASTSGGTPTYVPVTLTVSAGTAIGVSSAALTFNSSGSAVVNPQTLAVQTSDGSTVNVTSDSPFLTVTPSSISSGVLNVSVAPGSMAAGTYQGNVILTGADTPAAVVTIPVTLNIGATAVPALAAVTNGITFQNSIGSPGLIVALFGTGLGPATPATLTVNYASTLSTNVGGTQVLVDGIPSPVLFSSATQVNAILPYSLTGQTSATVQLVYQGVPSTVLTMPIQPATPGIFASNASGQGGGAILNQDLSVNSATNPAAAGTIVAIYGGGGGQTNPLGADGLLIPLTTPFPTPVLPATVTIGGQTAQVLYYGDAPGLVDGVLQINAMIPAGTASGPQPVQFTVGTAASQSNVVVYVQ